MKKYFLIYIQRMHPTSYMNISKMRVATGSGRKVRNRVRNQEEAYMDVWKLCERKWMFSSGSCSCSERQNQIINTANCLRRKWLLEIKINILLPHCGQLIQCNCYYIKESLDFFIPVADIQTGRCTGQALPCWVWTVPSDGTPASVAQKHKMPLLLASGRRMEWVGYLNGCKFDLADVER